MDEFTIILQGPNHWFAKPEPSPLEGLVGALRAASQTAKLLQDDQGREFVCIERAAWEGIAQAVTRVGI